jgi:UDP-N-acetylglucosamine 2-epimerase (non-hydrolysing)
VKDTPVEVAVVFGTRPEAVKLAPVIHALTGDPRFTARVVNTGQHRELLDPVLRQLGIEPERDLSVLRAGQALTDLAGTAVTMVGRVLEEMSPDVLVVQGDTTTAMAAALAGFYHQVPVVHVEAGLRTGDRHSPYPEEVNRRVITQLSDLHLAPTPEAMANLVNAAVPRHEIVVTGNTVIDALLWMVRRPLTYDDPGLERLDTDGRRLLLVTTHRRESWGEPMAGVARALRRVVDDRPDVVAVLPVHANPAVRDVVVPILGGSDQILLCPPQSYGAFARLLQRAFLVVTDSGGVQEEAPSLGKPVLVLRDNTERPEAVAAGVAELVGTDEDGVVAAVERLLDDKVRYDRMAHAINPYGDGRAASRCVAAIARLTGLTDDPVAEFSGSPHATIRSGDDVLG